MQVGRLCTTLAVSSLVTAAGLIGNASADSSPESSLSAVVLRVAPSEADLSLEASTTLLVCEPQVVGTHPAAGAACDELSEVNGVFDDLTGEHHACTLEFRPVTATAYGVWKGAPVFYSETFANRCSLINERGTVFDF
ncbi:SSI family serine proteinase inhibitor [Streptomyces lavendulocolor]|uniref:SSI family serine proteinase inhibitor n=1 Tax=Streptomyces lavendulocolor TaxID=67316 RepID=UPI0033DF1B92